MGRRFPKMLIFIFLAAGAYVLLNTKALLGCDIAVFLSPGAILAQEAPTASPAVEFQTGRNTKAIAPVSPPQPVPPALSPAPPKQPKAVLAQKALTGGPAAKFQTGRAVAGPAIPKLNVQFLHCRDEYTPWLREAIQSAGFDVATFRSGGACGEPGPAVQFGLVCGNKALPATLARCGGVFFKGAEWKSYIPGLEYLGEKSGFCHALNSASLQRGVEFDVAPRCFELGTHPSPGKIASVASLAVKDSGVESFWFAKGDRSSDGHKVHLVLPRDFVRLPPTSFEIVQKAIMNPPTLKGKKIDSRHFFVVPSADPPRLYFCRGGFFRSGSKPLVDEVQLRAMGLNERRNVVVTNFGNSNEHLHGSNQQLDQQLKSRGYDGGRVQERTAEKVARGFLAVARNASCQNPGALYDCNRHFSMGISDSVVDMTSGEPYIMELMFANGDEVLRGHHWADGHKESNTIARHDISLLLKIALAPARRQLEHDVDSGSSFKNASGLSIAASALLADAGASVVLKQMLIEAVASGENCDCLMCDEPERFVKFYPLGAETSSFGHKWTTYYELMRHAKTNL